MAHGQNAAKNGHNREYWSRRPCPPGAGWGPWYKHLTHRRERRAASHEEYRAMVDADDRY